MLHEKQKNNQSNAETEQIWEKRELVVGEIATMNSNTVSATLERKKKIYAVKTTCSEHLLDTLANRSFVLVRNGKESKTDIITSYDKGRLCNKKWACG